MGTVRKITMKEIAELSGVGKSTISRYFNGGYVKEETRKRIASIIQQYNYEPNSFARLKAKSSRMATIARSSLFLRHVILLSTIRPTLTLWR